MAKNQKVAGKRSGFWVKRESYATFNNSGMYVDLNRFFRTDKGKKEFKSVASSALAVQAKKSG